MLPGGASREGLRLSPEAPPAPHHQRSCRNLRPHSSASPSAESNEHFPIHSLSSSHVTFTRLGDTESLRSAIICREALGAMYILLYTNDYLLTDVLQIALGGTYRIRWATTERRLFTALASGQVGAVVLDMCGDDVAEL